MKTKTIYVITVKAYFTDGDGGVEAACASRKLADGYIRRLGKSVKYNREGKFYYNDDTRELYKVFPTKLFS